MSGPRALRPRWLLASAALLAALFINRWVLGELPFAMARVQSPSFAYATVLFQILCISIFAACIASWLRKTRWARWLLICAAVGIVWSSTTVAWPSLENFFLVYPLKRFALILFLTFGVLLSGAWLFSETTVNRREILLATATSIAALFLVLAAIEAPAAMNAIDYRTLLLPKEPGSSGPHNRVFRPDGYFARPPHDAFTEERPGDFVVTINVKTDRIYRNEYIYDSDGFRNREDLEDPDVIFLGDSFAEGYRVAQDETVTARFAALRGLCARSLGISDFSTYHARSALRAMMPDSGAPVVVWLIFEGNDVPAPGSSYQAFLDDYGTGEKSTYADRSFVLNAARIFAF